MPKEHHLNLNCHLGDEVVVEEDVGWSGQHGVGGGVPGRGLQEGVGREAGHRGGVELWLQVHQSHRHLRGVSVCMCVLMCMFSYYVVTIFTRKVFSSVSGLHTGFFCGGGKIMCVEPHRAP